MTIYGRMARNTIGASDRKNNIAITVYMIKHLDQPAVPCNGPLEH